MIKFQLSIVGLLLAGTGALPATAQRLDPAFTTSSIYAPATVFSAVEQADGKRVVAGSFSRINGVAASNVSRFNADGTLDADFQRNVGAASLAYRPRVLSNGQLVLISLGVQLAAGGLTRESVLRLNADGTGDAAFNPGTGATANDGSIFVDDALPLPNGQLVVVGPFDHFNGAVANGIVRLTATGAVDPSFRAGQGASNEVETIAGLPNGQLLIGGYFETYDGHPCPGLARLNADGSFDASFTAALGNSSEVLNIAVQPDGRILVAGGFQTIANGHQGLTRLLSNGALDPSFNPPAELRAYSTVSYFGDALQLQPDGKLLFINSLGLDFAGFPRVACLNPDGSLDNSFQVGVGAGPNSAPSSLTRLASGKVLVGGSFTSFSSVSDRTLVQLTSTGTVDPTFQPLLQTPGSVSALVRQADGKLVAGGNFSEINGRVVRRLARFEASGAPDATFATDNRVDETIVDLALQPDGRVLAATQLAVLRFLPTGNRDNSFVAAPDASRPLRLLLQPDGRLLVGRSLSSASSSVVRLLADGTFDASFALSGSSAGQLTTFQAMALQPNGQLLVAGSYRPNGSTTDIRTVVRLGSTGAVDATFVGAAFTNAATFSGLNSLVVQPDGKVLVGGRFTGYGGANRANLARLNADGTLDAGFVPPGTTGTINTLLLQPNNRVLAGGLFVGASVPANLARLLPNGQADASFAATAVPNSRVRTLLVQPDGALVTGGDFSSLSGEPAVALARLTAANVLHVAAPRAVAERTAAWPVPAHTLLHVQPDPAAHPETLDLLDALGRPVRHQALTGGAATTLAVEALPAGTYLLRVTYREGTVVRRIQVR
ncbi:T9SS type A sorting domain-containing protein [uncultured Hymenobacter sp.]|uniref:T9SS type A sorting domain-containing protein n=1 Tax=uncultured Hymenobacter sp. TaxID=170016 RepID=UPI0035CA9773